MLQAAENADAFIEDQQFKPAKEFLTEQNVNELSGSRVGAYQIKNLIGQGGMGSVYLASRVDDFEKEVAIKIIRGSNEDRGKHAEMFRRERQILAKLEHPNIARILDGGSTSDGHPFIVMEFVDGKPLDEYCRENRLSITSRLSLFQSVCETVAFAHRNLIVHRDLKPRNILVTSDGTVKLLDFGIAKLLDKDGFDFDESKTIDGGALTLDYASPEQITGGNITVASDIYSLGVILYELVAGQRPHDLKGLSIGEKVEKIRSDEPVSPSAFAGSFSDSELDSITLKSLGKTPETRYSGVDKLNDDIENYLHDRPISARQNTAFYRIRKSVARHKVESLAAAVFVLLAVGWFATALFQWSKATDQARLNRQSAYAAEMVLAASEYKNANLNRTREIVNKYIPRAGEDDLRGFEWYFLNGLLNPESKIRSFHHNDEVWSTEFSPDGKFIGTACNDNRSRIWNVETGEVIETAEQPGAWKLAFFPDGKRFAVASSSTSSPVVKVYDTANAREVLSLNGHSKRIRAIDISPDGKTIATGSQDGSIRLWDAGSGAEIRKIEFDESNKLVEFHDVQFSRNGDRLAVLGFETLVLFDTTTWKGVKADSKDFVDRRVALSGWKLAFSPDEKLIAVATFEGDVVFVGVNDLKIQRIVKLHQSNIKSLAFSADGGTLLTASWDRTVKATDVQSGESISELHGHFSGVHDVAFSPDGNTIATASADFDVTLWNTRKLLQSGGLQTHGSSVSISDHADVLLTWNGADRSLSRWNVFARQPDWTTKTAVSPLSITGSTATNQVIVGDKTGTLSSFSLSDGSLVSDRKVLDCGIYSLGISPDGRRIYAGCEDGTLAAIDAATLLQIYSIKAHDGIFRALDTSPDGQFIVTGGNDDQVNLFRAQNGEKVLNLSGHTKALYKTLFSDDGKFIVSAGADDVARVWQVSDGKLIQSLSGMSGGIFAVAFSPDGKRIATASDVGVIRLWDRQNGNEVFAYTASQKKIDQLRFSQNSETLISSDISGIVNTWKGGAR